MNTFREELVYLYIVLMEIKDIISEVPFSFNGNSFMSLLHPTQKYVLTILLSVNFNVRDKTWHLNAPHPDTTIHSPLLSLKFCSM